MSRAYEKFSCTAWNAASRLDSPCNFPTTVVERRLVDESRLAVAGNVENRSSLGCHVILLLSLDMSYRLSCRVTGENNF